MSANGRLWLQSRTCPTPTHNCCSTGTTSTCTTSTSATSTGATSAGTTALPISLVLHQYYAALLVSLVLVATTHEEPATVVLSTSHAGTGKSGPLQCTGTTGYSAALVLIPLQH